VDMTRRAEVAEVPPSVEAQIHLRGPYSLEEVALMGFGHRDESSFDGVLRLACCVDGDYETQVGVEVRQESSTLRLRIVAAAAAPEVDEAATAVVVAQVARVLSADHDGDAFARICRADPVLSRLAAAAPGFRPALFYSPYEAALWSILSARRPRSQGIALRSRLGQQYGTTFDLAGVPTVAVPTPSQLLQVEELPGLPVDRIPRLHAIARAAQQGRLDAARLLALDPEEAMAQLQQLPGIGPFYAALILIRACGAADLLPTGEARSREAVRELYGWDRSLSATEYAALAQRWRPFRTWAVVSIRALHGRVGP